MVFPKTCTALKMRNIDLLSPTKTPARASLPLAIMLQTIRWPNEEILRPGRTLAQIVQPRERSVFKHLDGQLLARMLGTIGLGHFNAHIESNCLVLEQASDFLLQVFFLESKAEALAMWQLFKEILLVGETKGMRSASAHVSIVGSRNSVG